MIVTAPGIYDAIDAEFYHSDSITPECALSRGGIVTLLNETPAHFAARNPRLTAWPEHIEESTKAQDLGSVAHAILLGRGASYKVLDLADFRNKDGSQAKTFGNAQAKAAKEEAEAQGLIVLDMEAFSRATAVAQAAEKALKRRFGGWPLGESEQCVVWQRDTAHGPIWCRAMLDHFSYTAATILDLKTTGKPIADEDVQKQIAFNGLDIQAAWYTEGVNTVKPKLAGLTQFFFVFIETEPPYEPRFVRINESWMTRARFRIDRAANLFAKCLRANEFPGYSHAELTLSAPSWLEAKWENEELDEELNDDKREKAS